jgi:hypothetical protein
LALSLGNWAGAEPAAAAQWAAKLPPEDRGELLGAVAGIWASDAPEASLQWVRSLPEEDRAGGLEEVFQSWALAQPGTLETWLQGQPASGEKDAAMSQFSMVMAEEKPSDAMTMASGLQDPKRRGVTLRAVFRNWQERDPASAEAWRQAHPAEARDLAP